MNLKPSNFDFWIQNDLNVLLKGKHGVGKTAMVIDAFERNNLKYKYFSASTMDPWVDFIGVPKEKTDESGNSYLDLVRPQEFQDDEIEAIFMDEFSRAHKKVRNAVMELIQFKSINGRKFKNLKIVWAAINPEDDEDFNYDVDALDPAQEDRFHVHIEVPYKPDITWFRDTFGNKLANSAVSWWSELPDEIRSKITPRRLEYALKMYKANGNLRHILPQSSNVSKLKRVLTDGPIEEKLVALEARKKLVEARNFIKIENNYRDGLPYILKSKSLLEFFVPLISNEKLSNLMATEDEVYKMSVARVERNDEKFTEIAKDIVTANQNKKLVKKLSKDLHHILNVVDMSELKTPPQSIVGNTSVKDPEYTKKIQEVKKRQISTTIHRRELVADIVAHFPAKNVSLQNAIDTIEVLDVIAERSHSYTVATPELVGILNNCILSISQQSKMNWSDIITTHGSILANFVEKLRTSGRYDKIYQPGRYGKNESKVVKEMKQNFIEYSSNSSEEPVKMDKYNPTEGSTFEPITLTADWDG